MATLSTSLLGIKRACKLAKNNTVFCKKHPKHNQSPGVCSLCLNEKLSLYIKSSSSSRQRAHQVLCYYSSTTSSLSSYGSSSVSSCPSPLVDRRCYLLMDRGGGGSGRGDSWMKKSRSVAYKVDDEKRKKRTKTGFFFGLMGSRRENKRVF